MVRELLNSKGATFVELMVAAGLMGVVTIGVMKLSQTSQKQSLYTKQNMMMDDYIRGLRDYIADKANCDVVLRPSSSGRGISTPNLTSYPIDSETGMSIKRVKVLLPQTSTGRQILPVSIYVYFNRNLAGNFGTGAAIPVKKTTANGIFQDGQFIECSDYESEAERSAFKIACETLGGEVETDSENEQSCNFAKIPANHLFLDYTKKEVCEIYGGVYLGGKCNQIDLPSARIYGQNLGQSFFTVSGTTISTFRQNCPGANNFVQGVSSNGVVICKTIRRCTKGDAQCP